MKNKRYIFLIYTLLSLLTNASFGQLRYTESKREAAFDGYDLVSYYQEGGPYMGKEEFQSTYDGLTILFVSSKNKEKFDLNPSQYIPAYGGYCAIAASLGKFISPDFEIFTIQNDRLFLFEVRAFFNGKTQWQKAPKLNERLADIHYWDSFKKENEKP